MRVSLAALTSLAMVDERALDDFLVGPGDAVDDDDRAIGAVMRRQGALDIAEVADRQMDGEGGLAAAQFFQFLARRHGRGLHGGAGEDHGLGDFGQGEFGFQNGGGGGEGGHAGGDVIVNAELVEPAHLFGDGAIDRRIAGMDAGHVVALGMGGLRFRR